MGIKELRTTEEVDAALSSKNGTIMVFVNSVCGCSAGSARPALSMAVKNKKLPDHLYTVFAGVDIEATARARSYFVGYEASSPSIAMLKNGAIVRMIERKDIEGRSADDVARDLIETFEKM